jgi:hypothetical protein
MNIDILTNQVTIHGNIKSVEDFQKIKSAVDSIKNQNKEITIQIVDSLSITSSVIGYLNRIVLEEGIKLRLYAKSEQLILLLEDLGLSKLFNVKRV